MLEPVLPESHDKSYLAYKNMLAYNSLTN
jgi:hypothetical protein